MRIDSVHAGSNDGRKLIRSIYFGYRTTTLCVVTGLPHVSRRLCFALDLVNDAALIQEYCRMHQPGSVWPAVIDHIRAQGVESMEIWQRADRLFMIVEAADDYPRRSVPELTQPENDRWEQLMASFQRPLPDASAGEKWSPLRRIFVLGEHAGRSNS
jgi:L-rhamnose mutarotase